MEKEKRIEEMARVIDIDCGECYTCQYYESKGINCTCLLQAEELYNAGYRKQEDILHEWVDRETAYLNEIAELKKELKKELAEHEEFTKKAKAEIERLTEELDLANETIDRNNKRYERVSIERQKALDRVDFLKDALLDKIRRNEELITAIKQAEQQAVKDTAKEILQDLFYFIDGNNFWLEETGNQVYLIKEKDALNYMRAQASKYEVEVEE